MCMEIVIGTNKDIELVTQNEFDALHIFHDTEPFYREILGTENAFKVTDTFMGCGCGLSYGQWSKEDPRENHGERVKAVHALKHFLLDNQNHIKEILTLYHYQFDSREKFPKSILKLTEFDKDEFALDEDIIYTLDFSS